MANQQKVLAELMRKVINASEIIKLLHEDQRDGVLSSWINNVELKDGGNEGCPGSHTLLYRLIEIYVDPEQVENRGAIKLVINCILDNALVDLNHIKKRLGSALSLVVRFNEVDLVEQLMGLQDAEGKFIIQVAKVHRGNFAGFPADDFGSNPVIIALKNRNFTIVQLLVANNRVSKLRFTEFLIYLKTFEDLRFTKEELDFVDYYTDSEYASCLSVNHFRSRLNGYFIRKFRGEAEKNEQMAALFSVDNLSFFPKSNPHRPGIAANARAIHIYKEEPAHHSQYGFDYSSIASGQDYMKCSFRRLKQRYNFKEVATLPQTFADMQKFISAFDYSQIELFDNFTVVEKNSMANMALAILQAASREPKILYEADDSCRLNNCEWLQVLWLLLADQSQDTVGMLCTSVEESVARRYEMFILSLLEFIDMVYQKLIDLNGDVLSQFVALLTYRLSGMHVDIVVKPFDCSIIQWVERCIPVLLDKYLSSISASGAKHTLLHWDYDHRNRNIVQSGFFFYVTSYYQYFLESHEVSPSRFAKLLPDRVDRPKRFDYKFIKVYEEIYHYRQEFRNTAVASTISPSCYNSQFNCLNHLLVLCELLYVHRDDAGSAADVLQQACNFVSLHTSVSSLDSKSSMPDDSKRQKELLTSDDWQSLCNYLDNVVNCVTKANQQAGDAEMQSKSLEAVQFILILFNNFIYFAELKDMNGVISEIDRLKSVYARFVNHHFFDSADRAGMTFAGLIAHIDALTEQKSLSDRLAGFFKEAAGDSRQKSVSISLQVKNQLRSGFEKYETYKWTRVSASQEVPADLSLPSLGDLELTELRPQSPYLPAGEGSATQMSP